MDGWIGWRLSEILNANITNVEYAYIENINYSYSHAKRIKYSK